MGIVHIQDWINLLARFYDQYGYVLVFLGSLGENTALLGLVLPGGTLALLGAFFARQGTLNLGWVIFFAWLGTVLGYHVDYLLGRYVLAHVARRWSMSRLGLRLRMAGRIRLARAFLSKHGSKAILISHMVGHMRSFVALSAGMTHMRYPTFLVSELVAALLWNVVYCMFGYFVGTQVDHLQLLFERSGWVILGILAVALLAWHFLRQRIRQRLREARRSRRNTMLSVPVREVVEQVRER
jgi:membrane protein DedA with SNARE-associated domain